MYRIGFLLFSSISLWGCLEKKPEPLALPYYNKPDFTPLFIMEKLAIANKVPHRIGNFSLLNQDSICITQKYIEGKIHIANFIFTSCGSICPAITKNMKIVSDTLEGNRDIVFLSYSVTPWIDKPFVLKKFKVRNNIKNPNWQFLTGNKSDIYKLARNSYFAEEDIGFNKDSTEFLHTEHFILVDKAKRIRGIYNGTLSLEMQQLIEDIRTLEKENLSL